MFESYVGRANLERLLVVGPRLVFERHVGRAKLDSFWRKGRVRGVFGGSLEAVDDRIIDPLLRLFLRDCRRWLVMIDDICVDVEESSRNGEDAGAGHLHELDRPVLITGAPPKS